MSLFENLQKRWKAKSIWQVIVILVVFALTGTTIVWIMKPILFIFFGEEIPAWGRVVYYIFILPIYNLVLLFYGAILGQLAFFWNFEKRFFKRIFSAFRKEK